MAAPTLETLARKCGLATGYENAWGEPEEIDRDALTAALDALGLPADTPARLKESLNRLEAEKEEALAPLVAVDAGEPLRLPLPEGVSGEVHLEGGARLEVRIGEGGTLPAISEPGYHRLETGETSVTLAVGPAHCFRPQDAVPRECRLWGLAVQLYAAGREGDGGIGDFTGAARLAQLAAEAGGSAMAISPVHAMFASQPGRASPYSPSSRLLLNPLHADPAAVFGEVAVGEAVAALGLRGRRAQWEAAELIDWEAAAGGKLALLRHLFETLATRPDLKERLQAFRARGGRTLADHALFEALHARFGGTHWRDWPQGFATPQDAGAASHAAGAEKDVEYHIFLQWLAAESMGAAQREARAAGMAIGLIADLAVGADGGGSQAWSRQEEMLNGLTMGAPPDQLNVKGQGWGLTAFDPRGLRRTGFDGFIRMLRAGFAHAGGLRIDHVLGLYRLWLIPEGAEPTKGVYLRYPMDDLLRLVALESHRHRAIVIGEDLGTVPAGLRERLAGRGLLGMSLLYFERGKDGSFALPGKWRRESVAFTSTHDLPPIAGWWAGRDVEWRERLDLMREGEDPAADRRRERHFLWDAFRKAGVAAGKPPAPRAETAPVGEALSYVGGTSCPLALVPVEDLLGLAEQPNLPGTIDEHPNWRRRLPQSEAAFGDKTVQGRLSVLNRARKGT